MKTFLHINVYIRVSL